MHLVATSTKLGQHILREHLGVATRDVDVHVATTQEAIEHAIERGRIVRVPQLFLCYGVLGLVEKDVVGAVIADTRIEMVVEGFGVTEGGVGLVVKGDFNHMVIRDARLP